MLGRFELPVARRAVTAAAWEEETANISMRQPRVARGGVSAGVGEDDGYRGGDMNVLAFEETEGSRGIINKYPEINR